MFPDINVFDGCSYFSRVEHLLSGGKIANKKEAV